MSTPMRAEAAFAAVLKRWSAFPTGAPTTQALFLSALGGAKMEAGTIRNTGSENMFNTGPKSKAFREEKMRFI